MVRVDLKGVAKVTSRAGQAYYYAWRGGPRLEGEPGSPEFHASYNAAHEFRRKPDDGTFRSLVVQYRDSPFYRKLSETTKRNWASWLDRIGEHFGRLSIAQFDRLDKIKPLIRRWRTRFADKPRTADYAIQVLSRVLTYGVDDGRLGANACEGMKALYAGGGRADIIWTPADIAKIKGACSPEIAQAVDLAAHTGLRLGDLVRLTWNNVEEDVIVIRTQKTMREAIIPLYGDLQRVLAAIPRLDSTVILNSSKRRPWTTNGLGSSFNKAKIDAGMAKANLHFHDLRGTAATRFYLGGIPVRAIAEIMGWEEQSVERIIRRYVDRKAATLALIRALDRGGK